MIDKKLLLLLGEKKPYIFKVVGWMTIALVANIIFTACICYSLYGAFNGKFFGLPVWLLGGMAASVGVRYVASRRAGALKETIGRTVKKDLRERVYNKVVCLGMPSTDELSMAGLTQVAVEGIEQLDLYYSTYMPQFYYAMIAPVVLFVASVWIDWRVASSFVLFCICY